MNYEDWNEEDVARHYANEEENMYYELKEEEDENS